MDLKAIETVAKEAMGHRKAHASRETGFLYHHGRRTAAIALELASALGLDVDRGVLQVAGLFHDIGKGEKEHHARGAAMARELLASHCTDAELETICRIVSEHCLRNEAERCLVESRVIQDADLLDHAGAMDVWLTLFWSGRNERTIEDTLEFVGSSENIEWHRYLQSHLNFDLSRTLMARRLEQEDTFFRELGRLQRGEI